MTRCPPRHHGRDADAAPGPAVPRSGPRMPASEHWPALPYEQWRATLDTLHAHTQVLGKLSAALAPPEPQLSTPPCA